MKVNFSKVNEYLVKIFNDVLIVEEHELKKSQFNDLTIKEMHTIDTIGLSRLKTSSEVAHELSVTKGTLSVSINNLVKKNYVERVRSELDRRVVYLRLTKRGKLLYRLHDRFHREMVETIMDGLNETEQRAITKGLENLHHFLGELK
ncbi:MAG: MarR family transcriptional regulator [Streptococcaceae bacterium]|nr:MarR family transcriptional regulator [Streptococcaceae bacterium]